MLVPGIKEEEEKGFLLCSVCFPECVGRSVPGDVLLAWPVCRTAAGVGEMLQKFRETGSAPALFSGDGRVESVSGLESDRHRASCVCLCHKNSL